MPQYHYSPLSTEHDSVRLLCLMPFENESSTGIRCELFEYNLQDPGKGTHLYEALSYTWGDMNKPRSISINEQTLAITENLHAVLLRLRDRSLKRFLWIDAVCINQEDSEERARQIQLMAKIYSKAARVLVWLGTETDSADTALEAIRIAAENESWEYFNEGHNRLAIRALIRRPWFRRIWVLQEVAAARNILIMCGSMEIDGYAFCMGVNLYHETHQYLDNPIRSIVYLMRGAIFRSRHVTSLSGRASLSIRPLGELIDMFYTHDATVPVDKVYALLGMSSDDPIAAGLSPNYDVPREQVYKDIVKFVLGKQVRVNTWADKERAVIKSKGCVLGKVWTIESGNKLKVKIKFTNQAKHLSYHIWTLQVSAKHIRQDDIVCLLQGASKPMIVRPCKDYFTVIRIVAFPEGKLIDWAKLITAFPRDLLLIWNWENCIEKLPGAEENEAVVRKNDQLAEYSETESEDHFEKATRIWDVAMILDDVGEYGKAEHRLLEARKGYKVAFGLEHLYTPKYRLESKSGRTPLSWAAGYGHYKIVDLLIKKDNIDPDLKDSRSGRTPLSWAAESGGKAVVKRLLQTGKVDADSKDKYGQTPLSWAAEIGGEVVIKLLLQTGKVDADSKDEHGLTPLTWAALRGSEAVVKLLLETGKVEADSEDRDGRTPLSWAAQRGHKAVIKLLLETGNTQVESKDKFGQTPLSWAINGGYKSVVMLLRKYSQ